MNKFFWLTRYVAIHIILAGIILLFTFSDLLPFSDVLLLLCCLLLSLPDLLGVIANSKYKHTRLASNMVHFGLILDSQNFALLSARAQLLMNKGDLEGAERDIAYIIMRHPEGVLGYNLRSLLHIQRCDFTEGEDACQQILKLQPKNIVGLLNRAVCRMDFIEGKSAGDLVEEIAIPQDY